MTDESALALEAGPEVVAETPIAEGQVQDQTADGSESETPEVSAAKARRERQKAHQAQLREELDKARQAANEAEARRSRILDAGKQEKPPAESDYTDPLEYVAAKAVWASGQRLNEREASVASEAAEAARQRAEEIQRAEASVIAESWQGQVIEAKSRYADFEAVALDPSVPISEAMAKMLQTSDVGADVAYFLGQNKAIAAEISKLTPLEAARAIGRIEARVAAPRPRTETNAPAPISPVKGRAQAQYDPDRMSNEEFRAARLSGKIR